MEIPASGETQQARHALDPLTAAEMATAVQVLRRDGLLSHRGRLVELSLREPAKDAAAFQPGAPSAREAFVVTLEPQSGGVHEGVVDLDSQKVVSWREVRGVQPAITLEECAECEALVRADPDFRAGLMRRGITDSERVLVESWGIGSFTREEERDRRIVWSLCFHRAEADGNPYAQPIDGLHAIVDLNRMQVLRVEEYQAPPVPPGSGRYTADAVSTFRSDLKPLEIKQPEGFSFSVDGWEVRWQKWHLRVGFTPREGLVLHQVAYEDGGRLRSVLYRASFAELVIPYGDPRPGQAWKNAFDMGEYGIGRMVNSLELGCDCLGEIHYFDVDVCDSRGQPYVISRAICLHEEDAGLLWKHLDAHLGHAEVRRSRRLVVSTIVTVDNYEYAFYWYLYQDGTIEAEVKLTGIVLTAAVKPGETPAHGTLVAPQTSATYHQHFFSARLDLDVDGVRNTVYEVDTEGVPPGSDNPYGNAFVTRQTPFRSELEGQRLANPQSARYWLVVNPHVRGGLGQPAAYKLVSTNYTYPFAQPDSSFLRRAAYVTRHLWVTPYHPLERYPAGEYPNQDPGGSGLPTWTAADRPIEDTDVVLWYTLGSHHIPRPEDWPVMPVERIGFQLKPVGFFDRNPALDVPPSAGHDSCHDA